MKPSARLERLLSNPSYKKKGNLRHASIAAEKEGLARDKLLAQHFANWLTKLRSISGKTKGLSMTDDTQSAVPAPVALWARSGRFAGRSGEHLRAD